MKPTTVQTLYSRFGVHFDAIAEAGGVDTEGEVSFLDRVFRDHEVGSVLDLACGTGRHSLALAARGYEVTGIDYSPELLEVARGKAGPAVTFSLQDVSAIDAGTGFDAAICMWSTFGELPYRAMLDSLRGALRPGGLFVVDTKHFPELPDVGLRTHHSDELLVGDVLIRTEIDEYYRGRTRVRELVYHVGGDSVPDHSEMDMYTEPEYIALMASHGFAHLATHHDYGSDRRADARRLQMVFTTQAADPVL
ncbi:class I SAM-dependent methyltransferase [Streptomyces sp. NPDC048629]|uniref:class I SAM-dependent methyltransferase n=1 Tax=Streptomyces sp. NPDC048629 TaxID=3154824 RepID=UPI003418A792